MAANRTPERHCLKMLISDLGPNASPDQIREYVRGHEVQPPTLRAIRTIKDGLWPDRDRHHRKSLLDQTSMKESDLVKKGNGLITRNRWPCPSCVTGRTRNHGKPYRHRDESGNCTRTLSCLDCGHRWKRVEPYQYLRGKRRVVIQWDQLTERQCTSCGKTLAINEFPMARSRGRHGHSRKSSCKSCSKIAQYRCRALKTYGITADQYDVMLKRQEGRCAICGTDKPRGPIENPNRLRSWDFFSIDHCHATGKIRGLLCGRCNLSIGLFEDRADLLHAASDYINRHKT
jgi:hypothetical protein